MRRQADDNQPDERLVAAIHRQIIDSTGNGWGRVDPGEMMVLARNVAKTVWEWLAEGDGPDGE